MSVLDWGCGKGHVSKLSRDLSPGNIESRGVLSAKDDSAFCQINIKILAGWVLQKRVRWKRRATAVISWSNGQLDEKTSERKERIERSIDDVLFCLKPLGC